MSRFVSAAIIAAACFFLFHQTADAITAELAKQCREMAFKAHPSVPTGSKAGVAKAQREFYQTCIARNGKM